MYIDTIEQMLKQESNPVNQLCVWASVCQETCSRFSLHSNNIYLLNSFSLCSSLAIGSALLALLSAEQYAFLKSWRLLWLIGFHNWLLRYQKYQYAWRCLPLIPPWQVGFCCMFSRSNDTMTSLQILNPCTQHNDVISVHVGSTWSHTKKFHEAWTSSCA